MIMMNINSAACEFSGLRFMIVSAQEQSDNLHPLRLAVERHKYPNYQNFCSAGNMLTHEIRVKINLANRLW